MVDNKEWHKIGDTLCDYFGICHCQRKLKSIIDNLYSIYVKIDTGNRDFTGTEWLIIAILDSKSECILHGVSCEYPILIKDDLFWKWVIETKDSPNLEDN